MPATERAHPALSIIVPVLNEEAVLPSLLAHLRCSFPGAEIVVVDGGSADATVDRALQAHVTVLLAAPGRAMQMNLGAASARGDWLLFLHADCRPDFEEHQLLPLLQAPTAGPWGFFSVRLRGRSRALPVIAWFMNRRSRLTRVATGDQGLLVRRRVFERIGGFGPLPLMEDVDLSKRLRKEGVPVHPALAVEVSGRRWDERGAVRTVLHMWALRLAYWLGVAPERLWESYYGSRVRIEPPGS